MKLSIITLDGVQYASQARSVTVPTASGEITVLNKHIPLISQLKKGTLRVKGDETKQFSIGEGVLEVRANNSVVILTDSCQEL
ncbi:MAG: F0F1 ATP synthase subunit epsilon [Candidatus Harrisonbacteria bacterium]|nr:F0F1 ATP synthase subunit epsilon [Candidatus Harrisonbacteria bacterium]